MRYIFIILFAIINLDLIAQSNDVLSPGWHLKDYSKKSNFYGISADKAYKDLVKNKGKEIIVAILDTGCDTHCEELEECLWRNPKEIPDNNIDDDNNGYIDDIFGWNFAGGRDGTQVLAYQKHYVRNIYKLKKSIEKVNYPYTDFDENEMENYFKASIELEKTKREWLRNIYNCKLRLKHENDPQKIDDLHNILTINQAMYSASIDERYIIKDDSNLVVDKGYGNNNVNAESKHGTAIASCIGASNYKNKSFGGVANNVKLMVLRTSPAVGSLYDKDIVNAILYAVDNGANIINMSFTTFTNNQDVQDVLKYAAQKGVLIVRAAGNKGMNIDKNPVYPLRPNDDYVNDCYICVGETGPGFITKDKTVLITPNSNYGKNSVDIFAPGMDIYISEGKNKYNTISGTSLSCPIVSAIAAIVWGQYPHLKANDIKSILMSSAIKLDNAVKVRDGSHIIDANFNDLSVSGGIVNLYESLLYAKRNFRLK